jgi:hypothetical protein
MAEVPAGADAAKRERPFHARAFLGAVVCSWRGGALLIAVARTGLAAYASAFLPY